MPDTWRKKIELLVSLLRFNGFYRKGKKQAKKKDDRRQAE
jgi:hypothetical protein